MIKRIFELSTRNLDAASRAWLSQVSTENHATNYHGFGDGGRMGTCGATRHGWFMWVPENPGDDEDLYDMPPVLRNIMTAARNVDCDYLLFDADDTNDSGLPWFDEDGNEVKEDDNPFDPESPEGRAWAAGDRSSVGE